MRGFCRLFLMANTQKWRIFEKNVRKIVEDYFKTSFPQDDFVDINGKNKKFDFVDIKNKIVGDAKFYSFTKGGNRPSAKFSILNEYVWLLQKLPNSWKKFLVIGTDSNLVKKYVREYKPWLENITIFYSDGKSILNKIKKQ